MHLWHAFVVFCTVLFGSDAVRALMKKLVHYRGWLITFKMHYRIIYF
jgi:hypothetical protein